MAERKAKLTLKVGDKELQFEAEVEKVEAELHRLAAEMLRSGGRDDRGEPAVLSLTAPRAAAPAEKALPAKKTVPASAAAAELMQHATLDRQEVGRLYTVGASGGIALRTLPETGPDSKADALLLLLYGMLTLRGQSPSTAPALLTNVRDSGLMLHRASRNLQGKSRLVATSGLRRGMRYRLTPAGIEHCEKLIPRLLPLL